MTSESEKEKKAGDNVSQQTSGVKQQTSEKNREESGLPEVAAKESAKESGRKRNKSNKKPKSDATNENEIEEDGDEDAGWKKKGKKKGDDSAGKAKGKGKLEKGAKGDKGQKEEKGAKGGKGQKGEKGEKGEKGAKGGKGKAVKGKDKDRDRSVSLDHVIEATDILDIDVDGSRWKNKGKHSVRAVDNVIQRADGSEHKQRIRNEAMRGRMMEYAMPMPPPPPNRQHRGDRNRSKDRSKDRENMQWNRDHKKRESLPVALKIEKEDLESKEGEEVSYCRTLMLLIKHILKDDLEVPIEEYDAPRMDPRIKGEEAEAYLRTHKISKRDRERAMDLGTEQAVLPEAEPARPRSVSVSTSRGRSRSFMEDAEQRLKDRAVIPPWNLPTPPPPPPRKGSQDAEPGADGTGQETMIAKSTWVKKTMTPARADSDTDPEADEFEMPQQVQSVPLGTVESSRMRWRRKNEEQPAALESDTGRSTEASPVRWMGQDPVIRSNFQFRPDAPEFLPFYVRLKMAKEKNEEMLKERLLNQEVDSYKGTVVPDMDWEVCSSLEDDDDEIRSTSDASSVEDFRNRQYQPRVSSREPSRWRLAQAPNAYRMLSPKRRSFEGFGGVFQN